MENSEGYQSLPDKPTRTTLFKGIIFLLLLIVLILVTYNKLCYSSDSMSTIQSNMEIYSKRCTYVPVEKEFINVMDSSDSTSLMECGDFILSDARNIKINKLASQINIQMIEFRRDCNEGKIKHLSTFRTFIDNLFVFKFADWPKRVATFIFNNYNNFIELENNFIPFYWNFKNKYEDDLENSSKYMSSTKKEELLLLSLSYHFITAITNEIWEISTHNYKNFNLELDTFFFFAATWFKQFKKSPIGEWQSLNILRREEFPIKTLFGLWDILKGYFYKSNH